jgi:hypothetical protein
MRAALFLTALVVLLCFAALLPSGGPPGGGTARASSPADGSPAASGGASTADRAPYRVLEGKARTGMFGIEGEGYKFVYVIDRSASMGGSGQAALSAAKAALLASLRNLEQVHQFQIIFYHEKPTIFNPTGEKHRSLFATERNKEAAAQFIASITPFDGTEHYDAILLAIRLRPDVVFLLTDADDPKLTAAQLERINRLSGGITIHAIEFGSGPQPEADNFLVKLARENGGKHVYVDVTRLPAASEHAGQR